MNSNPDGSANAHGLLRRRAEGDPYGIAFLVDGTDKLRFDDWERRSNAVARGLAELGAGRGVRIALLFGGMEWIDYAIAYLGTLKTGATAVHLSSGLPAEELGRRLDEVAADGVISSHADAPPTFGGWRGTVEALSGAGYSPPDVPVAAEDVADILYTSGTTGPAKAYTVPHGNLTYDRRIAEMSAFAGAQHMLVALAPGTGSGAGFLNFAIVSAVVAVLCSPSDVDRMGQLIEQFRTGMVAITPPIAGRLIESRLHEHHDLTPVHTFANGSGPLAPALARKLMEMVPGARVSSACSQSEAAPALIVNVFDPEQPTSVGRPTPATELRIAGNDGHPLGIGEVGEIWLRHPAPRRLYLKLPELTARILADGWYRTADLGHVDSEGRVHFFDRRADAIRTRIELVSTLEVEAALYEHPAVREAAAFGVPDEGAQEVAVAVVLRSDAEADDLQEHLRERLPPHKVPTRVDFVDALPRNQQGKVLKRELRRGSPRPRTPASAAAASDAQS